MNKKISDMANLFSALSDESRLKIIITVRKRSLRCRLNSKGNCEDLTCIKDLAKMLDVSMPTVSHHVKELVNAGLLITKKQGRWSYLQINPKNFKKTTDFLTLFNQ